ncbi:MAG: HAMP domain-containing histidine kinase [Casimicrobiaceae bacterium]|nr:HAMP domain-containing histidine kinase [Casimicrobiaceae bacterium]
MRTQETSISGPVRVLRLLAFYRTVVAIALAFMAHDAEAPSATPSAIAYAGVSAFSFALLPKLRAHIPTLLAILLAVDLAFFVTVLVATPRVPTAVAGYLLLIVAVHGYLLRSRLAFAHAAGATLVLLGAETGWRPQITPGTATAALLGAGFFVVAAMGRLLGRNLSEAEALAAQRSEALTRMAYVNELVINELDSGVILLSASGHIVLANPQATRWLVGDTGMLIQGQPIERLAPELHAEWRRFLEDPGGWDGQPLTLGSGKITVLPRMVTVSLEGQHDTLILLEDVTLIEEHAQQIKLAALGRLSASLAHEIRNPLSAIKQAAQLLGENPASSEETRSLTRIIDKNTERIDRIIRDVSMLGRRDRRERESIRLDQELPSMVAEIACMIGAPESAISVEVAGPMVVVVGKGQLEEMLANLIGNAWRHSRQQPGSVRVEAARSNDSITVTVRDDGPGVAPEHRDKLFEPFYSGSGSTGLGLYLVREIVRSNGGRVRLAPSPVGASFVLELPSSEKVAYEQG